MPRIRKFGPDELLLAAAVFVTAIAAAVALVHRFLFGHFYCRRRRISVRSVS
ncbi:hypothetical protein [Luteolibacter soli]|uniref:hypothetical protein n=1 Tax=Luteolibacter soli TaxID=3135280 RepID=UPI003119C1B0